ncbi:MAG TPA: ThuA domain-containing protein [Verrucomicrobiae bacterium]
MKLGALVLCDDTWHPAATVRQGLEPLRSHGFDFEFLEDGAAWSAARMAEFPLVILAKSNMVSSTVSTPWLTAESQSAFSDYLQRGHGLLVVHAGTSRYDQLPAINNLIGGAFARHPDQCAVTLEPKAFHELTKGVGTFTVRDEHYFMAMNDDAQTDVFLHSHSEHGVQPAGWTRCVGSGRVCALTPGHNLEVWLHPSFQKLLLNALRWTTKLN